MMNETYKLKAIGTVYRDDGKTRIKVYPEYCKGLKYLSQFSHAIILYRDEPAANIIHTGLSQQPAAIIEIDEKNGNMLVELPEPIGDTVTLYDIKAYFPNEDRVREVRVPEQPAAGRTSAIPDKELSRMGTIRRIRGSYYLEFAPECRDYIQLLNGYSHLKAVWWFHKFDKDVYRNTLEGKPPYEDAPRTGVFATRSPVRPNPLAVTTVRILEIEQDRVKVSMMDCFDQTPLLGICPYLPQRDCVSQYRLPVWLEHWSQWLDDREFTRQALPEPEPAALSVLQKYIDEEQEGEITGADFFKEPEEAEEASAQGIIIEGARQNNLKNIDVTIPYGKITVITGVSGCGKSSLAFDTIYAESQHRYFTSMSLAQRSQFAQLERPEFQKMEGLPPAIAIAQRSRSGNPRSTVGTATDIYLLLRSLFAGVGVRHCPDCGRAVVKQSAGDIIGYLKKCRPGTALQIYPWGAQKAADELSVPDLGEEMEIYIKRLDEAVKQALKDGSGAVRVMVGDEELFFQTTEKCYHCDHIMFTLSPADFSFNNTESMCPVCSGLGIVREVDAALIVTQPEKSILDGASPFWGDLRKFRKSPNANWMRGEVLGLAEYLQVDLEQPWNKLPEEFREKAIFGSGDLEVTFNYENKNGRTGSITRVVEGAWHILKRLAQSAGSARQSDLVETFMEEQICSGCSGERLKMESRLVTVAGTRFPETVSLSIEALRQWVRGLPAELDKTEALLVQPLLQELDRKLKDYITAGLGYLTLDRSLPTLSGGEAQRLQLVSQLNSGISNILYILDEPTAGLHPKDYDRLMKMIIKLKRQNNTVIIVEHTPEVMRTADYMIDMGSLAGRYGGYIAAQGTPEQIMNDGQSETGLYLAGKKVLSLDKDEVPSQPREWLRIEGIQGNNLKDISVQLPARAITCITGVSGSGKSSLVELGIGPAVQAAIKGSHKPGRYYQRVTGAEQFGRIIHVTQQPIGRSSRSTPATYTGMMDEIRRLFAATDAAGARGYGAGRFSYNSKEGQCPECSGYGYKTLDAVFMPDAKTRCPLCHGSKFHADTLAVRYREKNIAEVLNMSISEAGEFFGDNKKLGTMLKLLDDIGLGYLKLGQSAVTLSGGEAQRIKLATELSGSGSAGTLYILDEPTTGLHFKDIQNLLNILARITAGGSTVVLIEHNLDVIRNADWIIDLGPEGGSRGGALVVQGTFAEVCGCSESHTGRLLSRR